MSKETIEWLNTRVLVGNTDQRGHAWHYKADAQGEEPNHYPGFIPVDDVKRRLFSWTAIELPVYVRVPADLDDMEGIDGDGMPFRYILRPDRKNMAASDNYDDLGMFKDGYGSHDYGQWLVDNVATIIGGDLGISSAGLLSNRAVAWVEVSVPDTIEGPAGVTFRPNLVACTSHNGTLSTTHKRTATATVCDNTLSMALGEVGQVHRTKHTKNSALRIEDARAALAMIHQTADAFTAQVKRLTDWKVGAIQLKQVLNVLVPVPEDGKSKSGKTIALKKQDQILDLLSNDLRVAPWAGTAFGVVQAFNTWEHHIKGTRGGTSRAERNMLSGIDGSTDKSDAEVLNALLVTA